MDEKLWWYLARAGGLTAWWLLCLAVLWGLLLSTRLLGNRAAPAWLLDLHRMIGGLAVVFTALHMTGLFFDQWSGFSLSELLVPLQSKFKPTAVAWGIIAVYLMVAIEVTSLLRRRIPDVLWRWVHRSAFGVFVLATLHTFTTGTDSASPWIRGGAVVVGCAFVFLLVYRLTIGRRPRDPRPAAPGPVAAPEPALVGAGAVVVQGSTSVEPAPVAGTATMAASPRSVFHTLRVTEIVRETADAVSVVFDVPQDLVPEFRFDPGQHLTLRMRLGQVEVRRSYSLCSGVTCGELRIAVKQVEGGLASPWVNSNLSVGDEVEVAPPAGRFRTEINPLHTRHLLGVAAGSGITPVLSILKSVLAVEPGSRFTLLYGNRDAGTTIFRDKLALLEAKYGERLRVVHVFSRCEKAEPRLRGRLDAAKLSELEDLLELHSVDAAYLCGPKEMTLGVRDALLDRGLDRERVHVELFGGAAPAPAIAPPDPSVAVRRNVAVVDRGSRSQFAVDAAETVLDAGLRAGVDMPYSCRDGVCGTCRAKLMCGQVRQDDADLSPAEIAAGYVLTCQARPQTDDVVISLDEG